MAEVLQQNWARFAGPRHSVYLGNRRHAFSALNVGADQPMGKVTHQSDNPREEPADQAGKLAPAAHSISPSRMRSSAGSGGLADRWAGNDRG